MPIDPLSPFRQAQPATVGQQPSQNHNDEALLFSPRVNSNGNVPLPLMLSSECTTDSVITFTGTLINLHKAGYQKVFILMQPADGLFFNEQVERWNDRNPRHALSVRVNVQTESSIRIQFEGFRIKSKKNSFEFKLQKWGWVPDGTILTFKYDLKTGRITEMRPAFDTGTICRVQKDKRWRRGQQKKNGSRPLYKVRTTALVQYKKAEQKGEHGKPVYELTIRKRTPRDRSSTLAMGIRLSIGRGKICGDNLPAGTAVRCFLKINTNDKRHVNAFNIRKMDARTEKAK